MKISSWPPCWNSGKTSDSSVSVIRYGSTTTLPESAAGVAEQLILVAGARAAPLDQQALAGGDEHRVAPLLEAAEQRRHRHAERLRQALQRRQRRRGDAVLDLRQHAERKVGGAGEVGGRDAELVAEAAHLAADGDLEHVVARTLQRVRILLALERSACARRRAARRARAGLAIGIRAAQRLAQRVEGSSR